MASNHSMQKLRLLADATLQMQLIDILKCDPAQVQAINVTIWNQPQNYYPKNVQ